MPHKISTLALAAILLVAVASCDAARPRTSGADAAATPGAECARCHGDPTRTDADPLVKAAPPVAVDGSDGGAHLAHLRGGAVRGALACGECHVVPTTTAHFDGKIDVTFGALARTGGVAPTFSGGSCATVYCHGATLDGGTARTPVWSGGAAVGCTSCHGYPPPSHAATSTSCFTCHPGTAKADGSIDVALGNHVNGRVDVNGVHQTGWADPTQHGYAANGDLPSCRVCHGNDFAGGTTGVSCNACHANTGFATWQSNCTFCHGTRTATYAAADLGKAAPPAGTQGETAATARAVGAHQKHLAGGSIGKALACTDCHATLPTDLSHVDGTAQVTFGAGAIRGGATPTWNGTSCANYCHGSTLDAGGSLTTPAWTGGASQAACGTCHAAPPPAPHTTSTACGGCHTGYTATAVNPSLHLNGVLDASGSSHPAGWSAKEQHGYGANKQGLSGCKSCHGTNLDGVGGSGPSCATCHASAGIASWQTSCTFCHGSRTSGASNPPVDTQGGSAATNVSVGVHASHVNTTLAAKIGCVQCHPDRTGSSVITDAGHIDGNGIAEVAFGTLAKTGAVTPVYTRTSATSATCASTYCHGNFVGGANATPSWTSTTQVGCTSCHGAPPSIGAKSHHAFRACGDCHVSYTSSAANATLHLNGRKDVGNRITTYSTATRTCTNSCHGSETWR
jgi:predicted CxxxxCH...CXXCH cytochrome family protein